MVQANDSDDQIEFTKCILEKGILDSIVEEGEWFSIEIKKEFDISILKPYGYDLDSLIGFKLNNDNSFTKVRLRLGFFTSVLNQIIHKAIYQMKLKELARVSFEIDPEYLDESLNKRPTKNGSNNKEKIFLDLCFDICLVEIESNGNRANNVVYKLNEDQLYAICLEHKNDANELYKKNLIRTAFQRYRKAISFLIIAQQMISEKKLS